MRSDVKVVNDNSSWKVYVKPDSYKYPKPTKNGRTSWPKNMCAIGTINRRGTLDVWSQTHAAPRGLTTWTRTVLEDVKRELIRTGDLTPHINEDPIEVYAESQNLHSRISLCKTLTEAKRLAGEIAVEHKRKHPEFAMRIYGVRLVTAPYRDNEIIKLWDY